MVGVGILHQRGVIQSALHVSIGLGVEVVGVVGEGYELYVGAGGDALDVVQRRGQRTGAVGILGVAVELTEVQLILGLSHGEEPVEAGLLAVGTLGGDHHRAAVGEVGSGRVSDTAAFIHGAHGLAVHRHGDGGLRPGIGQRHGDVGVGKAPDEVGGAVDGVENPVRFCRVQVLIFLLFCKENDVRCPGSQFFS